MSIEDTVKKVTEQLNEQLNQQVARPLSDKALVEIIMTILNNAYKDTPEENHKKLYQQLTLISRPYALEFSHSPYAIYLRSIKKLKILQDTLKVVDKCNNTSIFNLESAENFLAYTIKILKLFEDAWDMQDRYPMFINMFTRPISALSAVALGITLIPTIIFGIVVVVISSVPSQIIHLLLNGITANKALDGFNDLDCDYPLEFATAKANYIRNSKNAYYDKQCKINKSRLQEGYRTKSAEFEKCLAELNQKSHKEIYSITDEDWLDQRFQTEYDINPRYDELKLHQSVVYNHSFILLKIVFHDLIKTIQFPNDSKNTSKMGHYLSKIPQILVAVVLFPLFIASELLRTSVLKFLLRVTTTLCTMVIATNYLLLLPLYIKDFFMSKRQDAPEAPANRPTTTTATPLNSAEPKEATVPQPHTGSWNSLFPTPKPVELASTGTKRTPAISRFEELE